MKLILTSFLFIISISALCQDNISNKEDIDIINKKERLKKLVDSAFVTNFNGNYDVSIKTNLSLLELAKELDDPYYLHRGYSILGYNYLVIGDTINAKESFKKSEEQAIKANNSSATGRSYLDIANLYSKREAFINKSIPYYKKAIKNLEKANDSSGLASAHYNILVALLKIGDNQNAFKHINSIKNYISNIEDDSFCEISVNSQIAKYYTSQNDFKTADVYYASVIEDSKKKEYWQELENTFNEYSESLISQGRLKEAIKAKNEYFKYYRINENIRRSEENRKLTASFEVEEYKKEAIEAKIEKDYLNKLTKNKNQFLLWLTILSTALLISFICLLVILKKRKKLNTSLEIKNKKYLTEKKKAEELSKLKSTFLSTVSHELRTPLYGVVGLSSILLDDNKIKHQEKNLKSLKFSADYLLALINDVLQINKLDSKENTNQKTTFCLRKFVTTIVSSFQYKRTQNNNNITVNIDSEIPDLIAGNENYLSQVLMNLIGNAHKFTENGDIYLDIKPVKRYENLVDIEFVLKDTGIGIPKEKQQSIFDEFSQVSRLNSSQQGTGLGLSIVKKLLNSMNSQIELESELNKGSTFKFIITFDFITQKIDKDYIAPTHHLDTSILNNKKVLIVDDNAINRIVTQKILEKINIISDQATNGEEAISLVSKNKYDIILMDVNMPVKDGIEATKEIRTFNTHTPIIALTAVELNDMKTQIVTSGMNDIVLKPYNIIEFHSKLVNAIQNIEHYEAIKS